MKHLNRKTFLHKTALAALGSVILPSWAASSRFLPMRPAASPAHPAGASMDEPDLGHYHPNEYAIIDLHCHPSLKMYLFGRKLWRRHTPGLGINAVDIQDDMKQLTSGTIRDQDGEGFVRGMIVAHYLPERGIEQWNMLKEIFPRLARVFKRFTAKIEDGNASNFTQLMAMIRELNSQKDTANKKKGYELFVIAKNFQEFNLAIARHQFPIAHAIEGAHAIGRNMSDSSNDASKYIDNLIVLKENGVCMMTLAHFFANDLAYCVEGISPDEKKRIGMKWTYTNTPIDNLRLTRIGEQVVSWMLDHGMIIDLTHSTPAIRDQVFRMNLDKPVQRPIVFTHTGAQEIFAKYDKNKYPNFGYYGVTPEEILRICGCNGTIGVIPEVFWLAGGDTHMRRDGLSPAEFRNGIPYMVETIQYINSMTPNKDYRNVSIGTDFDGFADSPQDLYEPTQLDGLIEALREALTRELGDAHAADEAVKRITSGNALRVLQNGWI